MSRNIGGIGPESIKTTAALEAIGLATQDIANLSPEDQFQTIAEAIGGIDDPTRRAAAAMAIFGEQGRQLLPMLQSIRALRQEARDLGLAPSGDSVAEAAKVTDAINRLRRTIGAAMFEIGAAIAPVATKLTNSMTVIVRQFAKFVKENGQLVVSLAKATAKFLAITAAVIGFGLALKAAALVLAGLTFLLANPAIAAGLVGIFTAAAVAAKLFGEEVKRSFAAVSDFAAAGDFAAAWAVIVQQLKVTWLEFTTAIPNALNEAFRLAAQANLKLAEMLGFDVDESALQVSQEFDKRQRELLKDLVDAQEELARLRTRAANQRAAAAGAGAAGGPDGKEGAAVGPATMTFGASSTARAIMEQTRGPAAKQDDIKQAVEKQTAANRENTARIVAAIRDGRLVFT